jgi:hypothetical protein
MRLAEPLALAGLVASTTRASARARCWFESCERAHAPRQPSPNESGTRRGAVTAPAPVGGMIGTSSPRPYVQLPVSAKPGERSAANAAKTISQIGHTSTPRPCC